MVATAPRPLSSLASIIDPSLVLLLRFEFKYFSLQEHLLSEFVDARTLLAGTLTKGDSLLPYSLNDACNQFLFDASILASGLSILLTATTNVVRRQPWHDGLLHGVCGITPSSAATTKTMVGCLGITRPLAL
ncbi:MAG: hypothetical protein IPL05_12985 [Betaproteobacteria bacterium]|nr:hypothetical protein [Betaproteobacteria bacterium]